MMKPTAADELIRDPSKLILTNPGGRGYKSYNLIRCIEVPGEKEDSLK